MHMHMARLFLYFFACLSLFAQLALCRSRICILLSHRAGFPHPFHLFFFIFFSFLLISRCLPRQSLRPLLSAEFKRKSSILCAQIHMENQGIMVAAHDEDGLT